ncbi:30S ribosomal protein S17 [Candidatus Woesebacteria bacterium]|jgi:small subunit ribosomal protein S17|nr:30S ribosomal protein S17 [Candidatus Woesebacteria bacterium]MBP9687069.1 30S ribosomal protein S17 [Candidatus Woesebacteria bacterium]
MKIFSGRVVSTKMAKTATVAVDRFVMHPIYKKRMKRTVKYQVHDEVGVKVGDYVKFAACAPVSRTKRWQIVVDVKKTPVKATKEAIAKVSPKKEVKKAVKTAKKA